MRQLRTWIAEHFPQVRVATVEMERFSIGEEIRLAKLAQIYIGTYGSGMWWPIFMERGSYVMWLVPYVHLWRLA